MAISSPNPINSSPSAALTGRQKGQSMKKTNVSPQTQPRNVDKSVISEGEPTAHHKEALELRGLRWRMFLGALPSCPTSVKNLRHAAADGRRRYAEQRRRVLVNPYLMEEIQLRQPLTNVDNPLSQDPDSVWGQYFRNAELERTIEKDLTRLYPEHGDFFQSPGLQAMLSRILLVWSLNNPNYSYRQGMHELLAPLLYALHADVEHFSEVKERYGDLLSDNFDDLLFPRHHVQHLDAMKEMLVVTKGFKEKGVSELLEGGGGITSQDLPVLDPDGLGSDLATMIAGNDSYGAEGELGSLLSSRFMEHDAYAMFDALMSGKGGAVAMAEFFIMVGGNVSSSLSLSPVLDASNTLYQALAAIDHALYSHLWEMGVEPQFFALRWLRVLFGREFELDSLLLLWDAIFSESNLTFSSTNNSSYQLSHRSVFILAFAVSMILHLKPLLLAAPNATSCLQKLLSFPQTVSVRSLIESAKAIQPLVVEAVQSYGFEQKKVVGSPSCSKAPSHQKLVHPSADQPLPDSYWEEKWKNSILKLGPVMPNTTIEDLNCLKKSARRNLFNTFSGKCAAVQNADAMLSKAASLPSGIRIEGLSNPGERDDSTPMSRGRSVCLSETDQKEIENLLEESAISKESPGAMLYQDCGDMHEGNSSSVVDSEEQSSTESVLSDDPDPEDIPECSTPLQKTRTLAQEPHSGRFSWLWNIGKTRYAEKDSMQTLITKNDEKSATQLQKTSSSGRKGGEPANDSRRFRWWTFLYRESVSNNQLDQLDTITACNESCNNTEKSTESQVGHTDPEAPLFSVYDVDPEDAIPDNLDLSRETTPPPPTTELQALGQMILNNIQILESALAQATPSLSEEGTIADFEGGGEGHIAAALTALIELRKISSELLQI